MTGINFKKVVECSFDEVIERVTNSLKKEGFGILTRIDLHSKFLEKLGKQVAPAAILGACNPQLAFEAYQRNTDVASLLPCNAVVRDLGDNQCFVEIARPSAMMEMLDESELVTLARDADERLERCLIELSERRAA